nr:MAG TPA: hypothetical protein [Caudoviricetes sp.]
MSFVRGNCHITAFNCCKTFTFGWIIEKDCLSLQAIKHTTIGIRDASLTALVVSVYDVLRMQSKLKYVHFANFIAGK